MTNQEPNINSENKPKFPSITPETINKKDALLDFMPLAEMTARKELGNMPSHMADFRELVNLALIKINQLIKESFTHNKTFKPSYIIQGIRWDYKNKKRKDSSQRGDIRTVKKTYTQNNNDVSLQEIQEAVIETVMSINDEDFSEIADQNSISPSDMLLVEENKKYLHQAIALLPDNYRKIIELRFYKGLKGIEIAEMMNVSSARITRIIQDAISQMQKYFTEKNLL